MKWLCYVSLLAVPLASAARNFTPQDLVTLDRPGVAVPSPDGKLAVFSSSNYTIATNSNTRNLWLLDIASGKINPLTAPGKTGDSEPLWLDSATVGFVSSRTETSQLWSVDVTKANAQPVQVTNFTVDIGNVKYHPKANLFTFSTGVYADGSIEKAVQIDEANKLKRDSGLVYDSLFVRHWDHFITDKKQNIFSVKLNKANGKYNVAGKPVNIMANVQLESPVSPFGDAGDYDISPDGKEIAFISKKPGRDQAWETDINVYVVPSDGSKPPKSLTDKNLGQTSSPTYSPDGRTLAWLQMERRGFEADRKRVILFDRKKQASRYFNKNWDRSPSGITWSLDSKKLYLPTEEFGRVKVFAGEVQNGRTKALTQKGNTGAVFVLNEDTLFLTQSAMNHPNEFYTIQADGKKLKQVSRIHEAKTKGLYLPEPEEFWFTGAKGAKVHGWILKPNNFDPKKKYPVAFLVHGGPQSAWLDSWSTRWNPEVYASAGNVVIAINPRGSTGYGQKFTDEISQNWGGLPFEDLMKGLDFALGKYKFADKNKICALGASYGGYMMNWFNGHTDRFKCLVNHDGMFSSSGTYYSTEELWFPEWEFGGKPWEPKAKKIYEKWSPANYVQNWKTPTLVIHGGKDYRLVDGEGFSTFTALQRQNIPSRLVYFPDENHWVLKHANSLRWHSEVLGWIQKWTQ
ncbi:prolyl oligopeptidase family protein [Basidiobolus meristosporus CBS 931.73]|uniref:Dipeptidyl-peptidase V n=1 Tax=Basidiobolus meristosporus CBS 931.73 TaxID=1314790 RepID=A0A1Y1XTP6_9FUNG|nr:prolyl oligopeptidase family protein [Basidiobolus meristosporus CBS 931.73]|eukprot:ORX89055.1 prolyl oligopeptidase family protein [Basidiobolus meristosporus CBS 931.73]